MAASTSAWLPRGRPPGADDLAEFLGRWQDQGLRYVAVLGPTATGKSSLGLAIARLGDRSADVSAAGWPDAGAVEEIAAAARA